MHALAVLLASALALSAGAAAAYPGGTPHYQTDVAPFCASCHSSRQAAALRGAGDRATRELADNKHLALIETGAPDSGYADMSDAEQSKLLEHIRALDQASTVSMEAPERVEPGAVFSVRVKVTGGAGPAVGVGLVSRDHRWFARPAASVGWTVAGTPQVIGPDDTPQTDWLDQRPADLGRNLSFVNVSGIRSDAATAQWSKAQVIWKLRAPQTPGSYPLAAVYLYGTETASPFGTVTDAAGNEQPRGGFTGHSGRVLFTPMREIQVGAPPAGP